MSVIAPHYAVRSWHAVCTLIAINMLLFVMPLGEVKGISCFMKNLHPPAPPLISAGVRRARGTARRCQDWPDQEGEWDFQGSSQGGYCGGCGESCQKPHRNIRSPWEVRRKTDFIINLQDLIQFTLSMISLLVLCFIKHEMSTFSAAVLIFSTLSGLWKTPADFLRCAVPETRLMPTKT